LLKVGKSDREARRVLKYIETESPIDFFRRVGLDKVRHTQVMQLGGVRSLTRKNKAVFDQVYRLYTGFIYNGSGNAQMNRGAQGPGYGGRRTGYGMRRRAGWGAVNVEADIGVAITKIILVVCMLFALNGAWLKGYGFRGLTLLHLGRFLLDEERGAIVFTYVFLLVALIIAIIVSVNSLVLTITGAGSSYARGLSSAGSLAGFLRFFDSNPLFIYLLTGIYSCVASIVFLAYFYGVVWESPGGAPIFMLVVSIILIVVAAADNKPYKYSRF